MAKRKSGARRRRISRSAGEWRAILDRFEASGLTRDGFCRRESISPSSFSAWKKALAKEGRRASKGVEFVDLGVAATAPESESLSPGEAELALPGGVRLRWRW